MHMHDNHTPNPPTHLSPIQNIHTQNNHEQVDSLLCQRTSDENEATRRLKTEFLVQLDGCGSSAEVNTRQTPCVYMYICVWGWGGGHGTDKTHQTR